MWHVQIADCPSLVDSAAGLIGGVSVSVAEPLLDGFCAPGYLSLVGVLLPSLSLDRMSVVWSRKCLLHHLPFLLTSLTGCPPIVCYQE